MLPRRIFFAKFQSDLVHHARILSDRTHHHEIRRVRNTSTIPYTLPEGKKEPKLEPEEYESSSLEFMYRVS